MKQWWRALFGPAPPVIPPAPPVPDPGDTLATIDAARQEIRASGRAAAREAARERVMQAALRKQIRHGNFVADRLRGQSGGR